MDDMVIVVCLRTLTKWINGCNMRCYIILRARENRVLCTGEKEEKHKVTKEEHDQPFHYGIDCLNFSQIGQKWENIHVYASYELFLYPSFNSIG